MKTLRITDPQEIQQIISRCPYCMVGIATAPGQAPYVLPMNFAWEDGTVYLHSGPTGRKLELMKQSPDISLTFCEGHELVWMHEQMACSYSMKSRSVMCHGEAEPVEDLAEKRRILTLLMRHYTDTPCGFSEAAVRHVCIWRVQARDISCRSFGLRPSEL